MVNWQALCFQEPFIQACVTFLKRRCPSIMGSLAPEKEQPKSAQLPPETLATMLACLQSCAGYKRICMLAAVCVAI